MALCVVEADSGARVRAAVLPDVLLDGRDLEVFGAVELEKTDWRPWRVTPAVAPLTRASIAAWPRAAPEVVAEDRGAAGAAFVAAGAGRRAGRGAFALPLRLGRAGVRLGPDDEPCGFDVPLLGEADVLPAGLFAVAEGAGAGAAAGAGLAAGAAAAGAGVAGGGTLAGAGVGGACEGDSGVPNPGPVHAQAMPAPIITRLSVDSTAMAMLRVCLRMCTNHLHRVLDVERARAYHGTVSRAHSCDDGGRLSSARPADRVAAMTAARARRRLLAAVVLALCPAGAAAPSAVAVAAPSTASVVRVPFPRYDGTLTPYTFVLGYPLVTLVYDTLTWRDAGGVPQPWLARTVTRSRGGRRVTVRLRRGVRWHDGRPLTAADVAFTFRFVARHFQPRFTPQLRDLERVRATGPLTVTFDLQRPSLGFKDQPLADVPILPRHLWLHLPGGRRAPRGLPVGSGPYRVQSAGRRAGYVLRSDRGYFRGVPRVREIRVPIISDAEATFEALRERRVDMVPLSLPRRTAEDLASALGIAVRRGPSYTGTALLMNVRRAPFDDPSVRRAVAAALDLGRIARGAVPAVVASQGQIHPASRWSPGIVVQRPDLRAARRALARVRMRILAPANDPVRREAGRQVVLALRRAGADARLAVVARSRLGHAIGEDGAAPDFDAAIQSTPALASEDPDYLRTEFGSAAGDAPLNFSGYHSPVFDRLARRVASAPDRRARLAATRAEQALLARDLPSIPVFFTDGVFAFRPAIYDGWLFVKGTGILDKRSFLPSSGRSPAARPVPASGVRPAGGAGGSVGLLDVVSIAVLVGVAALAVAALASRRGPRRR